MSENNEQTEILREILKWVKVSSLSSVKEHLTTILKTDTEKLIYHFSDGNNPTTQVVKMAQSSSQKVSDCWKEWKTQGIGETVEVKGGVRFKRTFNLEDFGIDIPTNGGKST
ncbi:hypothetical protein [Nitrosopumilus sp.]|uniref:hypothetical protein n=1 Tax=Nitrosopumilus sp. TaxID=2024843 RepID=UPI003D13E1EC